MSHMVMVSVGLIVRYMAQLRGVSFVSSVISERKKESVGEGTHATPKLAAPSMHAAPIICGPITYSFCVAPRSQTRLSSTFYTALLSGLLGRGNGPVSRSRVRVIRAGSGTRWASRRLRCIRVRRGGGAHSARGRRSGVAVVGRASFSSGSTVAAAAGAAGSEPCQGVAVVCVLYGGTSRPRMPKFGAS